MSLKKKLLTLLVHLVLISSSCNKEKAFVFESQISSAISEKTGSHREKIETEYHLKIDPNFSDSELKIIGETFESIIKKVDYRKNRDREIKITKEQLEEKNSEPFAKAVGCNYKFIITDSEEKYTQCQEIEVYVNKKSKITDEDVLKHTLTHEMGHILTRDANFLESIQELSKQFSVLIQKYDPNPELRFEISPSDDSFSDPNNPNQVYVSEYADNIIFLKRGIVEAEKKIETAREELKKFRSKKKTKEITGEIKNLEEMLNELTSGIPVEKNLATEVIAETFDSMINGKEYSSPIINEEYLILKKFLSDSYGKKNIHF